LNNTLEKEDKPPLKLIDRAQGEKDNGLGLSAQGVSKAWLVNGAYIYH